MGRDDFHRVDKGARLGRWSLGGQSWARWSVFRAD